MNYEENIQKNAGEMIENLITWILENEQAEIRYDDNDDDQWAIVTMHIYEEDKEVSVRLHANDQYDLYFGYYDDQDEFFEIIHPLTIEEKDIIPESLRKLMKNVLAKEEGIRIPSRLLSK